MESNELVKHLASVLGDHFSLTLEDIEKEETEADKEIVYGLICLHDDLKYYKSKSDHLLENMKNTLFSSAAITITGKSGVIKEVNDSFALLSGYSKKELFGKNLGLIDSPNNQNPHYQNMRSDLNSGKTWRGEICCLTKSGETFWLSTHIFPIKNEEGNVYEFWSVSTDISERKQIEIDFINKNKELEQFTYMLSHDLKAPGRQINSIIEFIQADYGDTFDEDCMHMFSLLKTSALKLNNLVDGILEYSRAEHDNSFDNKIDLHEVVDHYVKTTSIPENISIKYNDDLPVVTGNSVKMDQIIDNLLGNSIKYMHKEKGEIIIRSSSTAEGLHLIEISDNGIGIGEKHLEKIFEMFYTAHGTVRKDSTGIGLAVIKKIIESYGGEIGCKSKLGEGSTFWFTWPKAAA